MTADDEAFVRAIVDRPGDDLPRLVYADWLDERGDERGEYLRTELELFHNDDVGGLRALRRSLVTTTINPVWAARVSRPPGGVCCEFVEARERGPALTVSKIRDFEVSHGIPLSIDYQSFMLNYNGGVVEVGGFDTPHGVALAGEYDFYPLPRLCYPSIVDRRVDAIDDADTPRSEWFARFLRVGHNPDHFGILLGVAGVERGTVTDFDFSSDWSQSLLDRPYMPIANSFAEYLAEIGPQQKYR